MRTTVGQILGKKKKNEKIVMLTAYDYSTAMSVDKAGADIVLVGDSLANVVLGLDSTKDVGMQEMIHHTKAVNRAVENSLLVGDMPWEAYQADTKKAVDNARRFIKEAGCNAVKLEWFDECSKVAGQIVKAGIPLMGHVGLTPQTADKLGGFKVQGKDRESAIKIINSALELEKKGCFSVVLECIPDKLAQIITEKLTIPTIGIGAGPFCDGQVLVINDLLGLFDKHIPKFVKKYASLSSSIKDAVAEFATEVKSSKFPDKTHSYSIKDEELNEIKKRIN